ncbi:MAG: hypothetical protein HC933_06580 [Pleurocapsa sp. SU_196_0]|nr:hypothetical protein [Pleurocapsa sp. SU_196_0]
MRIPQAFWFVSVGVLAAAGSVYFLLNSRSTPCRFDTQITPEVNQVLNDQNKWKVSPAAFQKALDEWTMVALPSSRWVGDLPQSPEQKALPFTMMARYYRKDSDVYTVWFLDHGNSIELSGLQRRIVRITALLRDTYSPV